MSEGTNRNLPASNTLVQLLALYANSESHNAQRHRRIDGRHDDANSRPYCVVVGYDRLMTEKEELAECDRPK